MRTWEDTLDALHKYEKTKNMAQLKRHGFKPWWPFWADIEGLEFSRCITPDLLHQLHKGLFKTHIMEWLDRLMEDHEMDAQFQAMLHAKDLRHFKRGVNTISQWTGQELKEMMKQFLLIVSTPSESGAIPDDFTEMVRTLLDFAYLAHSAWLSEVELKEMEEALADFHWLKKIVVELGMVESESSFDWIPKIHMLGHYAHSICELGTPDGYNSEMPKRLHIEFAKKGWQVSNHCDPIPQIIAFVQRWEAIKIHHAHLDKFYGERTGPDWGDSLNMVGGHNGNDGGDESDGDSENGEDDEGVIDMDVINTADPEDNVAYPQPKRYLAF